MLYSLQLNLNSSIDAFDQNLSEAVKILNFVADEIIENKSRSWKQSDQILLDYDYLTDYDYVTDFTSLTIFWQFLTEGDFSNKGEISENGF